MSLKFVWDEAKNTSNFKKHQIWFDEAQTIWTDSGSLEFYDIDHSDSEDRYIRIGYSTKNRILMVVYCEPEAPSSIRIISARKATPKECKDYEKGI